MVAALLKLGHAPSGPTVHIAEHLPFVRGRQEVSNDGKAEGRTA